LTFRPRKCQDDQGLTLKEQTGLTPIEIDTIYQYIVIIDLTQPLD
jgi:hypothetical protein